MRFFFDTNISLFLVYKKINRTFVHVHEAYICTFRVGIVTKKTWKHLFFGY